MSDRETEAECSSCCVDEGDASGDGDDGATDDGTIEEAFPIDTGEMEIGRLVARRDEDVSVFVFGAEDEAGDDAVSMNEMKAGDVEESGDGKELFGALFFFCFVASTFLSTLAAAAAVNCGDAVQPTLGRLVAGARLAALGLMDARICSMVDSTDDDEDEVACR